MMQDTLLQSAAHIVQLALTPVFLLSGIAQLLNVFSARLGRVSDLAEKLADGELEQARAARLRLPIWRSRVLDVAVMVATFAGALTWAAALVLFAGSIGGVGAANGLLVLLGAMVMTMISLVLFGAERLLAGRGVRHSIRTP